MIRFIVAFDETVADLGEYFNDCKNDIVGFLDEQNMIYDTICEIPAASCNEAFVDMTVRTYNPDPFVFIAYSHGIPNALRCDGHSYVSTNNNNLYFSNSLFFSNACLIGKYLGQNLIDYGCNTFVGFEENVRAFMMDKYKLISIGCDNAGLKYFFAQDCTIDTAIKVMKQHYTNQIDKLASFKDMVFASFLTAAREALIIKGNTTLTKQQLYYTP